MLQEKITTEEIEDIEKRNVVLDKEDEEDSKEVNLRSGKPKSTFNLEEEYFYQDLSKKEISEIKKFMEKVLSNDKVTEEKELKEFFDKYPKIFKGNNEKLMEILNKIPSKNIKSIENFKALNNYIIKNYFVPKPAVLDCYFFPNKQNEEKVTNMLRTCKSTLDIAIFALTNDRIYDAISDAHKRGVKVRIISDDECCKFSGCDVIRLCAEGVPCKTDNSKRYHMHHKMAILDNSVIITGSFNWTTQAVKYNQENILFLENKEIAQRYTDEYNKIFEGFTTVLDMEECKKVVEKEDQEKAIKEEKRRKEKEAKDKEKAIKDEEKQKEKEMKEQEKEKLKKEKEEAKKNA
ncbi:MAG: phospholipase D-like domain-containing protein, partial [archaeon]|nr:phospholipase D-like domain-containing protein [archaeon]